MNAFDGQTDGFTIIKTALHSVQRGKNVVINMLNHYVVRVFCKFSLGIPVFK